MFKNLFTVLFALVLFSALINAQERTFMRPDGKFYKSKDLPSSIEVMKMKRSLDEARPIAGSLAKSSANALGVIDTLRYPFPSSGNSNFGAFGQDVLLQWFKAPADLTIKSFAFYIADDQGRVDNGAVFEGKIVKVSLTEAQALAQVDTRQGYYAATGNGFNDATAFLDNPDRTGDWVAVNPGLPEPFGADIWSDAGFGAPITPDEATPGFYQWIKTDVLFEPQVLGGEIFGIAYKNTLTAPDQTNPYRLGVLANATVGYPGWKYYAQYRIAAGVDYGWWSRTFTWDFLVEVDITGNTPPNINSFTTGFSGTLHLDLILLTRLLQMQMLVILHKPGWLLLGCSGVLMLVLIGIL